MTIEEAIKHLEFSRKSYQNLIDNDTRIGEVVGKDTTGTWKADTSLATVYQTMRDTMVVAIRSLEAWKKVKAEIEDRFGGYSICEWFEDYDYEENNVSEYMEIGRISDIIDIINKHLTWYENGWDRIELCQDCLDKIIKAESEGER